MRPSSKLINNFSFDFTDAVATTFPDQNVGFVKLSPRECLQELYLQKTLESEIKLLKSTIASMQKAQ